MTPSGMVHSNSVGQKLQLRNINQKHASTYEINREAAKSAMTSKRLFTTASKTKESAAGLPNQSQTRFNIADSTPKL